MHPTTSYIKLPNLMSLYDKELSRHINTRYSWLCTMYECCNIPHLLKSPLTPPCHLMFLYEVGTVPCVCLSPACRYGFKNSPKLELVAKPKLGQRQVTLSQVTHWIENKLRDLVDVSSARLVVVRHASPSLPMHIGTANARANLEKRLHLILGGKDFLC